MDISLDLYRVFLEVAKTKSFSKAAEKLFVSQSAVSQSIKTFEKKLGFQLFIRTTKKVELTYDAEIFLNSLGQAFSIISAAENRLVNNQSPYSGELRIAATDTLCKYFLLEKINALHKRYPEIKIKIVNHTSLQCLDLLAKAKVDFTVINIPEDIDKQFRVVSSFEFRDVFVAHKDFSISSTASLKEISQNPLLVLDDKSVTRRFLDSIFLSQRIVIEPEIELQNIDILLEMAKIGLGISFVPDLCVTSHKLKIIETKEPIPPRQFGIVALDQLPPTGVANTFLSIL